MSTPDHEFVIIGAGPCGIGAGITLKRHGIEDFVIVERFDEPGGTWSVNTYPGIGCDVPTPGYEFFFARNPGWSRFFPKGAEINEYHLGIARSHGIEPHYRFRTDVTRQAWDEQQHLWRLTIANGREITARYIIAAIGQFSDPRLPDIPGVDSFAGKVQQPARWDHTYDMRGKRVIVVGTGASAVQIIPEIAPLAQRLEVFQRTPIYCVFKPDFVPPRAIARAFSAPALNTLQYVLWTVGFDLLMEALTEAPGVIAHPALRGFDRLARTYMRARLRWTVRDPDTRRRLMPGHGGAAKRPALSNTYLPTFNRPNVELVTTPIERVTETGIVTADGVTHDCDVLVLATGYHFFADPEFYKVGWVTGRDGRDLGEFFLEHDVQAYESASVPGFPNRWMLSGPWSWSHIVHTMSEFLTANIARSANAARAQGITALEVSEHAHEWYHAKTVRKNRNFQWYFEELNRDARTYYTNSHGTVAGLRHVTWIEMWLRNLLSPLGGYDCRRLGAPVRTDQPLEQVG
ncbi:flavin-containing monooxygenase [Nocardia huaxiensis]|uniref:NAD(P)/FAD-dependent oxidoreductase n=1 Tax=Nocardia huaxiensis TaxID=2755382 RepID=A0A7D6VGF6_9NOCA|nr:NAD(P)/FAD-dependent oxidoreductase [Nocardia huaxiensis]QLY29556.1 NAD(P)/FAD-dependent oxidoreductase [Nocardia huaxiensis]UFS96881.1 NAD(P)/FAD-dependent oxidoreductase [Nocardia huaxiensis]